MSFFASGRRGVLIAGHEIRDYLERRADACEAAELIKAEILPSGSYFRAVALCRDDLSWAKLFREALRLFAVFFLICGLLLRVAGGYDLIYSPHGFYALCALFVVLGVFSRFSTLWCAAADVLCVFLGGFLIFLSDSDFYNLSELWRFGVVWAASAVIWALLSFRRGVKALACVLCAAASVLYAVQSALPSGLFGREAFLYVFCAANGGIAFGLAVAERRFPERMKEWKGLSGLFAAFFWISAALEPVLTCTGLYVAPESFLPAAVCSAVCAAVGLKAGFSAAFHKANVLFTLGWTGCGLFYFLNVALEKQSALLVFSAAFFALTLAAGLFERFLTKPEPAQEEI